MIDYSNFRREICRRPTTAVILDTLAALATSHRNLPMTAAELAVIVFKPTAQEKERKDKPFSQAQANLLAKLEQAGAVRKEVGYRKHLWSLTASGLGYLVQHRKDFEYLLRPIEYLDGRNGARPASAKASDEGVAVGTYA